MRFVFATGVLLVLNSLGAHAKIPVEFHGLWLSDPAGQCSGGTSQEMVALASGGYGLYIDDKKYVTTESECDFTASVKSSCCNTDKSKTITAGYRCGSTKNRVMLHIEVLDGKPVLVEAWENEQSGPSVTMYFRRCPSND
jgi:hypothetical protein